MEKEEVYLSKSLGDMISTGIREACGMIERSTWD